MRKGKKDKLLLNLLEGERYKHNVAMVTDEGAFNQHEPNSNMARMFVVMLMIHVVVIGGIIIYDFMNGETPADTVLKEEFAHRPEALPSTPVAAPVVADAGTLEEHSTYTWKSGDSIPVVARRLKVSEETLIKMNKLDQGREIKTNAIILYPKQPVQKALAVGVAGANGELAKPAVAEASIGASQVPMNLALPGEADMTFSATIEDQLTPVPNVAPGMVVMDTPPEAPAKAAPAVDTVRVELPPAKPAVQEAPPAPVVPEPALEKKPVPAPARIVAEKPVPKAIPVPMPVAERKSEPVVKKIQEAPPAPRKEPAKPAPAAASGGGAHVVQSGDTMYRIASKHGISVAALQAANKSAKPESLRIGMKLVIPRK